MAPTRRPAAPKLASSSARQLVSPPASGTRAIKRRWSWLTRPWWGSRHADTPASVIRRPVVACTRLPASCAEPMRILHRDSSLRLGLRTRLGQLRAWSRTTSRLFTRRLRHRWAGLNRSLQRRLHPADQTPTAAAEEPATGCAASARRPPGATRAHSFACASPEDTPRAVIAPTRLAARLPAAGTSSAT